MKAGDRFGKRDDLRSAYERQNRRGDHHSRIADAEMWSRRKALVRERVSIREVVERVVTLKGNANARSLTGLCPFHAEATPSFVVYPKGSQKIRVGFFVCYGCDTKGDVIAFVMKRQGLGYKEAVELLESENGIRLLEASTPRPAPKVSQVLDRTKHDRALRVEREALVLKPGDPVDSYLRGRAIVPPADYGIGDAAVNAGWPVDLRFAPQCWHDFERRKFPAMIASIRGYDDALLTVHQTYLERRSDGTWTKASIEKPKMVVGPFEPGCIRLGPETAKMVGAEGIESSLSAMQLWRRSGFAFVNSGRMKTFEPPFGCTDFIWAADKGAKPGKPKWGEIFAHQAAAAFGKGRTVAVKIPAIEAEKGDFNDLLQQRAAERRSEGQ